MNVSSLSAPRAEQTDAVRKDALQAVDNAIKKGVKSIWTLHPLFIGIIAKMEEAAMKLNILRADPAGNITVFVLDPVEKARRAALAAIDGQAW